MAASGRTVLVVKDEPLIRMIAVETLADDGWTVVEFGTADEAAAFWSSHSDDVAAVFTDINMPGSLDGLDLASLVAKTRPSAVLVVTSGRYQAAPADLAGRVRFLPKPWTGPQLLRSLQANSPSPLQTPARPKPE